MVPIASFREPYLARIAQGALDAAGIHSEVLDEYLVQANGAYSQAVGGVKLAVAAEDVDREHGGTAPAMETGDDADSADVCPICGSGDIGANGYSPLSLIPSLFLRIPVFIHRNKYACRSCGAKW